MKKKILLVILALVLVGTVFVVKSTVEAARNVIIVKGLLERISVSQGGIRAYPPPPATLEITDEEVNAGMSLLCGIGDPIIQGLNIIKNFRAPEIPFIQQKENDNFIMVEGPEKPVQTAIALPCQYFNNFKVEFLPGKYLASAKLLKPVKGNIEIEGMLSLRDERNVDLKFEKILLDNQPASLEIASQLENIAQQEINGIAGRMKYLALQKVAISEGKIVFEGIFSFDELLCSFGLKNYCSTEANEDYKIF